MGPGSDLCPTPQRQYGECLLLCVQALLQKNPEACRESGLLLLQVLVTITALWGPTGLGDKVRLTLWVTGGSFPTIPLLYNGAEFCQGLQVCWALAPRCVHGGPLGFLGHPTLPSPLSVTLCLGLPGSCCCPRISGPRAQIKDTL